jgi:hypothetical protein
MSDWQKFYADSDGVGCNPVELKKAAQAEIERLSGNRKAYAATPAKTLRERIMDAHIPKTDAEWWAKHEIDRLLEEIKRYEAALDMILATGDLEPNRPLEDCRRYAKEALRR